MTTILLRGGRVHCAVNPDATALAVTDGHISWIGGEHSVATAGRPDVTIDLAGVLVTPGFVDAHVHSTDAGLALIGLDLGSARSLPQCLSLIREFAAIHQEPLIWGHGWDETRWPENRPPTRAEIDDAVGRRPAYLSRIDVHSALISSELAARVTDTPVEIHPHLPQSRAAHHAVRAAAKSLLSDRERQIAQTAFVDAAAAAGIVEIHECAFPDTLGIADLRALLGADTRINVLGYLAAAVSDPQEAREMLELTGAVALAGDLSVDGAIGSRTASLSTPYSDDHSTAGTRYLTDDQIYAHLLACVGAGIQPGFHAIGDDAVSAVARALRRAAAAVGTAALAFVTPRVEHAEMPTAEAVAAFAATGTVASVQPLFDDAWGGKGGMYAGRLGAERSSGMNPFAALASAGVPLAFGSDAPVTSADPWRTVQAAVHHRTEGAGISPRAAFTAHTRGGHRAAGHRDGGIGTIAVGAPAHLAFFRTGELVRPAADAAVARWSTDPRSRVPLLPDLTPGQALPTCLATMVGGRLVHDSGLFADWQQDG